MKKNGSLVTIAIPTYNRADGYLRNAIDCVLRQTYDNIEVI
jgi:glycosyltransferase involved in cell wall biosynthesis